MIKNLILQKPRSPKERYEGVISLPRFFDKLRASAFETLGEYMVGPDSALDNQIIEFLKVDFEKLLAFMTPEKTDEEIFTFIKENFTVPSLEECTAWSDEVEKMKLLDDPARQAYAKIVIEKMHLPEDITTVDWILLGDN